MKTIRNTTAKSAILRLISESAKALSQADIQNLTSGVCDRVTIYRVLDRLIGEGSVHKVVNIDGVMKYASCKSCASGHQHNHIHFNCQKCHSLTCLPDVKPSFSLPSGYMALETNYLISGICPQCNV